VKFQYIVCRPLMVITACKRRLIDMMAFEITTSELLFYS
jgi:hypothetical protein